MVRVALGVLALSLACACGGADVPSHNGYKSARSRPWQRPTVLELDEGLEAEVDDTVSYPKRERARWYAVNLPTSGSLEVRLTTTTLSSSGDVNLAFEVMDEGYQVLVQADRNEDDAGDEQKIRTLDALAAGRHYIHVYAQRRLDEADFTLQVGFRGGGSAPSDKGSPDFPAGVAYVTALADIPAVNDAPAAPPPSLPARKCKGSRCKKKPVARNVEAAPPPPRAIRARIAGIVQSTAGGTLIRIDRGAGQGIAVGWKGSVVTREGSAIPNGSFEISRVSPQESFGTVRASATAVTDAKYVRLRPP